MRRAQRERAAASLALAVLTTMAGCHSWVPIRPTDLPMLNGTSAWVHQPDGTRVAVVEPFDASVAIASLAHPVRFDYPVESTVEDKILVVKGANRGRTAFQLPEVTSVKVSQPNPDGTTFWATVLVLVGVAAMIALVVHYEQGSTPQ